MSKELLPCPFCGHQPILEKGSLPEVKCHRCGTSKSAVALTHEAVDRWNTRAKTAREAELVKAMNKIADLASPTTAMDETKRADVIYKIALEAVSGKEGGS